MNLSIKVHAKKSEEFGVTSEGKDIYEGGLVSNYLQSKKLEANVIAKEKDWIRQGVKIFRWKGTFLLKKLPNRRKVRLSLPQD